MQEGRKIRREVAILAAKLGLLAAPLLGLLLFEACASPIDFCAFRCWEAMSVRSLKWAFPGPFYPNQQLSRIETGDLGNGTEFAVQRPVTWVTDSFGFRNSTTRTGSDLDVVIVGDSFVAGSGLTQHEILPEVLEREHGLRSYGYAPSSMKRFLRDPRFTEHLPKMVVVAVSERSFGRLSTLGKPTSGLVQWIEHSGSRYQHSVRSIDRFLSPYLPRYAQARFRPVARTVIHSEDDPGLLFFVAERADADVRPELRQHFMARLREYHRHVTARGSTFLFLPIPDKEFVYADKLPSKRWPTMIPDLVRELTAEGIPSIDMTQTFLNARTANADRPLYQTDDTHWNGPAVEIAARLIHDEFTRISMAPESTVSR